MLYIGGFVQSFVHNAFDYDGQNYVVKRKKNAFKNIVSKMFSAIFIYTR